MVRNQGRGLLREDSGQYVAGTMGLGMREFGISQDALNFLLS